MDKKTHRKRRITQATLVENVTRKLGQRMAKRWMCKCVACWLPEIRVRSNKSNYLKTTDNFFSSSFTSHIRSRRLFSFDFFSMIKVVARWTWDFHKPKITTNAPIVIRILLRTHILNEISRWISDVFSTSIYKMDFVWLHVQKNGKS